MWKDINQLVGRGFNNTHSTSLKLDDKDVIDEVKSPRHLIHTLSLLD